MLTETSRSKNEDKRELNKSVKELKCIDEKKRKSTLANVPLMEVEPSKGAIRAIRKQPTKESVILIQT